MSAIDELRRMLDERGVEWIASGTDTCWKSADGYPMRAWDTTNGTHMRIADLTPEQAIAATLGFGECELTDNGPWGYPYVCSACDASFDPDVNGGEFNYCPNCGARVVSE